MSGAGCASDNPLESMTAAGLTELLESLQLLSCASVAARWCRLEGVSHVSMIAEADAHDGSSISLFIACLEEQGDARLSKVQRGALRDRLCLARQALHQVLLKQFSQAATRVAEEESNRTPAGPPIRDWSVAQRRGVRAGRLEADGTEPALGVPISTAAGGSAAGKAPMEAIRGEPREVQPREAQPCAQHPAPTTAADVEEAVSVGEKACAAARLTQSYLSPVPEVGETPPARERTDECVPNH